MFRSFTCCVGSSMESHALHALGIYYEAGDRLWVNLYVPSRAEWKSAGMLIEMQSDFPEGESASLKVTEGAPKAITLTLRRPSWAQDGFALSVNGEPVKNLPPAPSYVDVTRIWKTGDVVEVKLPKALRLQPTDNPRLAAVMWGPLVLAGDLGPAPERTREIPSVGAPAVAPVKPDVPDLVTSDRPVTEWLKPVPEKPGTFKTAGVAKDRDVEFVPFYRLHRRTYGAYWDLLTPDAYEKRVAERSAEEERERRLEAATVVFLEPGNPGAEKPFNPQGEETSVARAVDRRQGRTGKRWFSYDLPIEPGRPMALVATYHSDQRRARTFAVLVEGRRVGEQTLEQSSIARFFDVEYPLPDDILRGKNKVTVRFQAAEGNEIGPVFGLRIIRR
jgi:hypothetical protein